MEVETQNHRAHRKEIEGRDLRSVKIFQDWGEVKAQEEEH
jgi:hypothetical protein